MFEINFHSAVDLIQQALPSMRERGYGRILNVLSGGMFQAPIPYPGPPNSSHTIAVMAPRRWRWSAWAPDSPTSCTARTSA